MICDSEHEAWVAHCLAGMPEFRATLQAWERSPAGQKTMMFGQYALTDEARSKCRGLRHFCETNVEAPDADAG